MEARGLIPVARLSVRELELLRMRAEGYTVKECATLAFPEISVNTARNLFNSAFRKLGARNAAHATAIMDDYAPDWRKGK